jgi:methanol--5-hydroxybenzimidazolylcobamide Co-methyltransferase
LLVASDLYTDPQALILAPENVIRISGVMVKRDSYVAAARDGALEALNIMEEAIQTGRIKISEMETVYLATLREELNAIPDNESDFIEMMLPLLDREKFIPSEYGL